MPTTLMPSFKAFKALARSLKAAALPGAPDMALALKHLQESASRQDEGSFLVQTQGFLNRLKSGLEAIEFGQNKEISEHLEKLLSTFGDFIQAAEPKLADDIRQALETEDAEEKKEALLKLLEVDKDNKDKTFAAALAPHLKAFLTPSHLTQQEHRDAIKDRMSESLGELHQRVSDQAIYDPEKAWVMYLFKLIFNVMEMSSAPPLRSSVEKADSPKEKTRFIPMK